jgi:SAM-dependent methyltransferase
MNMLADLLSRPIHHAARALKLRRYGSGVLNGLVAKVEAEADAKAIAELWERVAPLFRNDPVSAAKYAQPREWLTFNALRVADLGLHVSPALRVLDIGCGPGYFVALARALGHEARGVDAPDYILNELERDVYATLTRAFHCRDVVSPLLIERFNPMTLREGPFDLITAFWICFNRHRQPDEWGVAEWRYFIEDALACLRPGGRIVLDLNENAERYGRLRYYDQATRDYFASAGSVRQGRVIVQRP